MEAHGTEDQEKGQHSPMSFVISHDGQVRDRAESSTYPILYRKIGFRIDSIILRYCRFIVFFCFMCFGGSPTYCRNIVFRLSIFLIPDFSNSVSMYFKTNLQANSTCRECVHLGRARTLKRHRPFCLHTAKCLSRVSQKAAEVAASWARSPSWPR